MCVALTPGHLEGQRQLSNPSERLLLKTLVCLFSKGQTGETNLQLFSYACWLLLGRWKENKEKIVCLSYLHWRRRNFDNLITSCEGYDLKQQSRLEEPVFYLNLICLINLKHNLPLAAFRLTYCFDQPHGKNKSLSEMEHKHAWLLFQGHNSGKMLISTTIIYTNALNWSINSLCSNLTWYWLAHCWGSQHTSEVISSKPKHPQKSPVEPVKSLWDLPRVQCGKWTHARRLLSRSTLKRRWPRLRSQ